MGFNIASPFSWVVKQHHLMKLYRPLEILIQNIPRSLSNMRQPKGVPGSESNTWGRIFFSANLDGLTNYVIRYHCLIRKLLHHRHATFPREALQTHLLGTWSSSTQDSTRDSKTYYILVYHFQKINQYLPIGSHSHSVKLCLHSLSCPFRDFYKNEIIIVMF